MKLKYYMRGLGIGMIVTAFILCVVLDKDTKTMSDQEVRARAKELGMVESTVLSQIAEQNKQDKTGTEETKTDESKQDESETSGNISSETEVNRSETSSSETPESEQEETNTEDINTEETNTEETEIGETEVPGTEPEQEEPAEQEEMAATVTIVINPGESSESVSRSVEAAGLVESARQFDKYLCNNGYDYIISVGTYEIPVGASQEEIAKIITKRK